MGGLRHTPSKNQQKGNVKETTLKVVNENFRWFIRPPTGGV